MIFVTGAARSGTSMTCAVLSALGVNFGGRLAGGSKHNARGFWENVAMRGVLKDWLRRLGADRVGQWPLPPRDWRPTPEQAASFRGQALAALNGAEAHKDPKALPIWPLIHAAFPEARWVAVRRDPHAIARSCKRASFMGRFSTEAEWHTWALEMGRRLDDLTAATDAVVVWPDPDNVYSFKPLADGLGLEWAESAVAAAVDPKLWHHRTEAP